MKAFTVSLLIYAFLMVQVYLVGSALKENAIAQTILLLELKVLLFAIIYGRVREALSGEEDKNFVEGEDY